MILRLIIVLLLLSPAAWSGDNSSDNLDSAPSPWMDEPPVMFDAPGGPLPIFLCQTDSPMFGDDRPYGGRRSGPFDKDPAEMRKHIEQFRMLKLLEFLDLEDDQEIAFLTRFKQLRATEDSLETERRKHVERLVDLVRQEDPDSTALMAEIDSVRTKLQRRIGAFQSFAADVSDILTPVQMGKLVIFHDRFEYELLERVRGFQNRRGGPGGPGAPDEQP